jgi:hypothetical protein
MLSLLLWFIVFCYFFKDVSTTLLVKPGALVDFLLENQNVQQPNLIDWSKVILYYYSI